MRSPRRPARVITLACVAIVATSASVAAVGPRPTAPLPLDFGMSVVAPDPGYGLVVSVTMTDGFHRDLVLETGLDGLTRLVTEPGAESAAVDDSALRAAGRARISGGGDACSGDAYRLLSFKWRSTWSWWFHVRSTPGEITKAAAERQLRAAVASITGSRNDCGLADQVGARASYEGRTTTRPSIRDGDCGQRDGKNVVGFGDLARDVLGLTCTAYLQVSGVDQAVESDVLLNKDDFGWSTSISGCSGRAIVRSVATHEFGHVFGLDHVGDDGNRQTMSASIGFCDDSAFTLGRGDVLGLRRRY